jgi:hypothetical protein
VPHSLNLWASGYGRVADLTSHLLGVMCGQTFSLSSPVAVWGYACHVYRLCYSGVAAVRKLIGSYHENVDGKLRFTESRTTEMTDDLQNAIDEARTLAHALGYIAGISEATRYMSSENRWRALAKYMRQYEKDNPRYARIKDD